MTQQHSSRDIARRIVDEVLADHAAGGVARNPSERVDVPVAKDTDAWRAARRIVEETLREHAARAIAVDTSPSPAPAGALEGPPVIVVPDPAPVPEPAPDPDPVPDPEPAPVAALSAEPDRRLPEPPPVAAVAAERGTGSSRAVHPVPERGGPVVWETWTEPVDPPRRTGRWLITTILAALGLAWLMPLAIDALRDLVAL